MSLTAVMLGLSYVAQIVLVSALGTVGSPPSSSAGTHGGRCGRGDGAIWLARAGQRAPALFLRHLRSDGPEVGILRRWPDPGRVPPRQITASRADVWWTLILLGWPSAGWRGAGSRAPGPGEPTVLDLILILLSQTDFIPRTAFTVFGFGGIGLSWRSDHLDAPDGRAWRTRLEGIARRPADLSLSWLTCCSRDRDQLGRWRVTIWRRGQLTGTSAWVGLDRFGRHAVRDLAATLALTVAGPATSEELGIEPRGRSGWHPGQRTIGAARAVSGATILDRTFRIRTTILFILSTYGSEAGYVQHEWLRASRVVEAAERLQRVSGATEMTHRHDRSGLWADRRDPDHGFVAGSRGPWHANGIIHFPVAARTAVAAGAAAGCRARLGGRCARNPTTCSPSSRDVPSALACAKAIHEHVEIANGPLPASSEIYVALGIGYGRVLLVGEDDAWGDEMKPGLQAGRGHRPGGRDPADRGGSQGARRRQRPPVRRSESLSVSGLQMTAYQVVR